jgi:hypothetical protein
MPWNDLANNQTISYTNLKDAVDTGVLSQKFPIPISNEQINKAIANAYVNIDTSYPPYAAKANNQLVVKSDLKSIVTLAFTSGIIWFGIDNNGDTSSPIQLLCGWNNSNDDGRIFRSTNFGSTYSSVLTINQRLYGVMYLPDLRHPSYPLVSPFLAVGEGGRIVTNSVTDCTSWITISSPTTRRLDAIAEQPFSNPPHAVIVGDQRILRTTTAGQINSWTVVNSASEVWMDVASGGNGRQYFVAVGNNNAVIRSIDTSATSWLAMNMPPSTPSIQLKGVTYSSVGDYWYAVGHDITNINSPFIMRCKEIPYSEPLSVQWEVFNTTGDAFLSGLTSVKAVNFGPGGPLTNTKLYVGGINYQYVIDLGTDSNPKNVVTRYDASFSGYTTWWMAVTRDPLTSGFDMAAGLTVGGSEFNSINGGYSNF